MTFPPSSGWVNPDNNSQYWPDAIIDRDARVDIDCKIGARTRIWQFASVIRGTVLGEDCNVASGALLDGPRFGDRCIVGQGVAIGPGFVIGNDVFIGPNVTFCNDRWPTVDKEGFRPDLLRRGFVTIRVKDGAWIGANAVILPGVTVGAGAAVAAGAVAEIDIPDGYLLTRSHGMMLIKPDWKENRMREVRDPTYRRQFA